MRSDGSNQTRLTSDSADDFEPAWSPDGTKIAFASYRDLGPPQIYVMNADGSAQTRISTSTAWADSQPAWSPDGTKIAFVTNRDGNSEIYVMNPNGSGLVNLTNSPGGKQHPHGRLMAPRLLSRTIRTATTRSM